METKTISMIRHPLDEVWTAMRDHLPEIAAGVDDVESVRLESRAETADGSTIVTNIWQARPKLPALLAARLKPEMLRWTDRAEWSPSDRTCTWKIDPHYFAGRIACQGSTRYEPAMGGRGTRLTFTSAFCVGQNGKPGVLEDVILRGAESLLQGLIPRNFQKIVTALAAYLDSANR
jgi:hypothetical protein